MLNEIIVTLDRLVLNPLRKQMFHQDCIDLRSLISFADAGKPLDETCLQLKMKNNYITKLEKYLK